MNQNHWLPNKKPMYEHINKETNNLNSLFQSIISLNLKIKMILSVDKKVSSSE